MVNENTVNSGLVATVDKKLLLTELRRLRDESKVSARASAFTAIIRLVNTGKMDG